MIVGSITQENLAGFLGRTPVFGRALAWIRALPSDPADGITELEGRDVYVIVHRYATRPRNECRWESHRHTADLQYVFGGGELVDWTPARWNGASVDYEMAKDFESWPANIPSAATLPLPTGMFAIFLPGELHRPMIANGSDPAVRKLVVKIHTRYLSTL